ncbi:MAG: hypothetical protein V1744_03670 [Candidatus Altiarchaeota archaeon]
MKLHLILLLALAAVIIPGCVTTSTPEVRCEALTTVNEMNLCMYNRSVKRLDYASCADILNETIKANCINDIAVSVRNSYPCKEHNRMINRDKCERLVSAAKRADKEMQKTAST